MTAVAMTPRNIRAGVRQQRPGPEVSAPKKRPDPEVSARKKRSGSGVPEPKKRSAQRDGAPSAVADIQRQRILGATAEVVAEHGAGAVTVAHIVERAGVSRRTFYELFGDREECIMAALDEAVGRAAAVVLPAYEDGRGWRERTRGGLAALLRFLDGDPGVRALLVVEALGAGPRALERRAGILDALIRAVDEGREESKSAAVAPPLTAEGVVGAVFAVIHARAAAGIGSSAQRRPAVALIDLLGPLMGMIVLPYLGAAAARRESERAAPSGDPRAVARSGNPLEGLKMRLTYRTIRVLSAVAQHPGASNRDVGDAAGMTDQGQISKLLARLEGLGLIRNTGEGYVKGAPNAWRLTERGEQVERALRV